MGEPKASLHTLICFEVASTCMKEYDLIVIGSGSAMNIVELMIQDNPNIRIAVIDKDEPGGICLTRGCIPSKILFYLAELVGKIEEERKLGIDNKISYHTSNSGFKMKQLPESIAIVGGGYIAAEFGHFFASMGSKVTIIRRNPQFVPEEEPEVSALAKKVLSRHINIITNHEVKE